MESECSHTCQAKGTMTLAPSRALKKCERVSITAGTSIRTVPKCGAVVGVVSMARTHTKKYEANGGATYLVPSQLRRKVFPSNVLLNLAGLQFLDLAVPCFTMANL